MDLEIIILSEVSQTEKNIIWYRLYMESKIWHKWTYLRNRNRLTDIETRLVVAMGEAGGGGKDCQLGISRRKLLYIEWINNKVLLYSTGNYIQYPGINHSGKRIWKRMYIYILFQIFPYRLLHNIKYSSLCYRVHPCWLSIFYVVVSLC